MRSKGLQMDGCCVFAGEAAAAEVPSTPTVALLFPTDGAASDIHAWCQRHDMELMSVFVCCCFRKVMQRSGYSTAQQLTIWL